VIVASLLLSDLIDFGALPLYKPLPIEDLDLATVPVARYGMVQTPFGPTFAADLTLPDGFGFQREGLPLRILVSPAGTREVQVRVAMAEEWFVDVSNISVVARFDPLLLRPVGSSQGFAEARTETGIHITQDGVSLSNPELRFSLPLSEIPNTGIAVSIKDLMVDFFSDATPDDISALDYGPEFQGVYAREAEVRLLPTLSFGQSTGLTVTAEPLVITDAGVTCNLSANFHLDVSSSEILPGSEVTGSWLSPDWRFGLQSVSAVIVDSVPLMFDVDGAVHVPILNQTFALTFGMEAAGDGSGYFYTATIESRGPGEIQLPFGSVGFGAMRLSGGIGDDTLELSGEILDLDVDLTPLQFSARSVFSVVRHDAQGDELRATLTDIKLGPLGTVPSANLLLHERTIDASMQRKVSVEAAITWGDFVARLNVPTEFPLPDSDETGTAKVTWQQDSATGQTVIDLGLSATVRDLDRFWDFIPSRMRPQVIEAKLAVTARYASAAQFSAATTADAIAGSVSVDLALRMPQLPDDPFDIFTVTSGDDDGIVHVQLALGVDDQGDPIAEMALSDPVGVEINLPGLAQPEPPIVLSLDKLHFGLNDSESEGSLTAAGSFVMRPISLPPSPISHHLERILTNVGLSGIEGTSSLEVTFKDDRTAASLRCQFVDAEIDIELLDTLAELTRGLSTPVDALPARGEIPIDMSVSFGLKGLKVQVGSLDPKADTSELTFELAMALHVGALEADGYLRFTDSALTVGLGAMEIPLAIPEFPLTTSDLNRVRAVPSDPTSLWMDARWQAEIAALSTLITQLEGGSDETDQRILREARGQLYLMQRIYDIYGHMSGTSNQQVYQWGVETVVGAMGVTTGRGGLHEDSDVKLKISSAEFILPFADPRGISVQGSASLIGFAPDDPLLPLEDLTLTLGLSSDQIYFSLEGTDTAIPLPDFGRYHGGSVSLSRFTIGFGYTKRSLAIAFGGELQLPLQLIADADTSQLIGFGVRLPRYTRLGFRLDLIPVPGPIPLVPSFDFSLDMNSPGTPGLLSTDVCTPFWDGLEFTVPGVIHAGFKKIAVSPFFGPLPITNVTVDGDLVLGNENTGLTLVVDNMVVTLPLGGAVPIPMLANPTDPWVDNLCFNVRIAGFGVNFNFRRPLPNFNPLLVFELLGLLADPTMPVDPNGPLANVLLVKLENAYITVPPSILRMFPDLKEIHHKPLNVLLNVGTLISATQAVAPVLGDVWQSLQQPAADIERLVGDLARSPASVPVGGLLAILPPETRKIRTGGSLAGFEATVVVVLITPEDARSELQRRDAAPQPGSPSAQPLHGAGSPVDAERLANVPLNLAGSAGTGRVHHPGEQDSNLFQGIEFESFSEGDVADIPAPRKPMAGVVMGAHVKTPTGQRYRFLGYLFDDGSFGLVSAIDVSPFQLNIAGISLPVLLQLDARLILQGRNKRGTYYGSITAIGHAHWKVVPGLLELEIASPQKPAVVELFSDGRLRASCKGRLLLYGGSAVVEGSIVLDEAHCFVEGRFTYAVGPIAVDMACTGQVGPGHHVAVGGLGTLAILGNTFSSARAMVTEDRAEFEARLNTNTWKIGGLTCSVDLAVKGSVNLQRLVHPEFALEGRGTISALKATVEGRAGIIASGGSLSTYAEGALTWQDRRWLEGHVRIDEQRVSLGGRTSFGLNLTPSNLAGIDLAHLYFRCDIQGEFSLDHQNGLAAFSIDGAWSLDARGAGGGQAFPLAAQEFKLGGAAALELQLIHVKGMRALPFDEVTIPVPKLTAKTPPYPVRFGYIGENMAFSWNGRALELGIPPWVHKRNLYGNETSAKLYFNYDLSFEDKKLALPLSGDFTISLVWRNGGLALKIARGSTVEYWKL
jgi:hypothetical protein